MTLLVTEEKKLARADASKVLHEIIEKGFYIQLPPSIIDEKIELAKKNNKLGQL